MSDFMAPGYSSFEDPMTHEDIGTSNSLCNTPNVRYTPTVTVTSEMREQSQIDDYENGRLEHDELD